MSIQYSCNIPPLIFSPVTHTDRCNEIRVLCRTGQLGNMWCWAGWSSKEVLSATLSAVFGPTRSTAPAQPFATSWPLVAPPGPVVGRSRLARRGARVPLQPADLHRRHQILAIVLPLSSHGSRGIGCLGRLQPHACPASQSPTTGPPAHCTYTTYCTGLRTATVGVLGRPSAGLPSAVSTFGPDELGSALCSSCCQFRRVAKQGRLHTYVHYGASGLVCHVPLTLKDKHHTKCASL